MQNFCCCKKVPFLITQLNCLMQSCHRLHCMIKRHCRNLVANLAATLQQACSSFTADFDTGWLFGKGAILANLPSPFIFFRVVCLLAHLSRRLTRWAYSIAMVRRPSVVVVVRRRRRPHFQTCISLKPVGQPRSNFMCSITGVGERLHKVLGQIRSKLWFPWQQKAPIDL